MARGLTTHADKPAVPAGFVSRASCDGVEEYVLKKNGLKVLYRYDDTAPVVGVMVTYLVGSRHEAVGYTGATHLLEHLMFKGSTHFPKRKNGLAFIDLIGAKGGQVNATTWFDRTNYYEVLPEEHFDFALAVEADRMRNAILIEKDRKEEMPAVRSEFAMGENDPSESLDKHLWATAYMAHPYHHSTIGWQDDFEQVSIERLREFYHTYYWPNNAVVTVVGSIPRNRALTAIREKFGVHPHSPHVIPVPYTKEPPQLGKRFVEVRRGGTTNLVGLAYKVPHGLHQDTPALMVLAHVLASGTTSRLHRSLVEKKLCTSVHTTYTPLFDPSLLPVYATLANTVSHERVERAILAEFATIAEKGITEAERGRIIANIETEIAFARDGHYATLSALNEAIAVGDWRFFFDLPNRIAQVTLDDVARVARTYAVAEHLTVGHYHGLTT